MARYEKRPTELRLQLAAALKGETGRTAMRLGELIDQWAVRREALLEELADPSKWKPYSEPLPERWAARVRQARVELGQLFGDGARDLMMAPALQLWWAQALRHEDQFLSAPSFGVAARYANELNRYQLSRDNLIKELTEKWSALVSTTASFRTPELQAIAEVDRLLQEILNDFDSRSDRVILKVAELGKVASAMAGRAADAVKKSRVATGAVTAGKFLAVIAKDALGVPGELDEVVTTAGTSLTTAQGVAETIAGHTQAQLRHYRELLGRERGTPLRIFKTTREEVERYLRDNADAQEKYNTAVSMIKVWAQDLPTPGQKADGELFAGFVTANLANIWDLNLQTDRQFREKFEGVFFGGLKSDTLEQLAQQYLFEQKCEQLKSRGAARRIEAMNRQLPAAVEAQIDSAWEPLLAFDSETPPEVRELLTMKNQEFRAHVRQHLRPRIQALLSTAGKLQELFGDSRIVAELDRRQLLEDIR